MTNETIEVILKMEESQNRRFKYYYDNPDFCSSPEYFKAVCNYRKNRASNSDDLLTDLVTSPIKGGFDAIRHVLSQSAEKTIRKSIDEAVKQAVIQSGGIWTD